MPARQVLFALALGACSFPPLDVEGRKCTAEGLCPESLTCVHGLCVRPGTRMQPATEAEDAGAIEGEEPDAGTTTADAGATAPTDAGASDAGSSTPSDAGTVTPLPDAGTVFVQTFTLSANGDDASWCDPYLAYNSPIDEMASASPYFDLSEDEANCRVGLRFVLPLAKGAQVRSAKLTLKRIDGEYAAGEQLKIGIFDSSNVPSFSDNHSHTPTAHGGNLMSNLIVGGYTIVNVGSTMTSPELSALVQAAVNRSDWQSGGALGLLLGPETSGPYWVRFSDSGGGSPPSLRIEWVQ